jgi:hypothetical protein
MYLVFFGEAFNRVDLVLAYATLEVAGDSVDRVPEWLERI